LRRHAERLLLDADRARDAVQDAWISIARALSRLDDPAKFSGWAYAIVTRRCVDAIRRGARDRQLASEAAARALTAPPVSGGPADLVDRLDIGRAIRGLPVDQRLMISLRYGEGLLVEEIAAAHGLPVGTVKSRLHAARQTLRLILEGDGHDPCR
jgi:RNA polymerase sigma-70 factor (ECF subfamily)